MTQQLGGVLDIVSAYPSLEPWSSDLQTGLDFVKLKNDLEREMATRISELTKGIDVASVRLGEGPASRVVKHLTDELNADVIVLGTAARKGVSGWMIGNTSIRGN